MSRRIRVLALVVGLAGFTTAGPVGALDGSALAADDVIQVVTSDENGTARVTKIWIVAVEGEAYIRTGDTKWGRNVERDANVGLRTANGERDLRVEFVSDEALRARVAQAYRQKYGWADRLISPFRGRNPNIMHLLARGGGT